MNVRRDNIFVFFLLLLLLLLLSPFSVSAQVCDVDADGDIDRNDVGQIFMALNTPASGPDDPRDVNGDGMISINDGRYCTVQCTLPRCAIVTPPADVATIDIAPDPLNFGDVEIGSSVNQSLVVNNTGTATLAVSSIQSSGAPFSVLPPFSFNIAVGDASQSVEISFSPLVIGDFSGTITFNSNADNVNPVVIIVTGRGIEAPPALVPEIDITPNPLDFGDVFVGSASNLSLAVANTGAATLTVSDITSSGAPYSVFPPTGFDIADGGLPRNVDIGFSPPVAGIFNGTITVNSNADNIDPAVIIVTGRGIEPVSTAEPDIDHSDSMVFGAIAEGESVERLLTVRNLGDAPLNVSDISSDNSAFVVSAQPGDSIPFTLDPGATQNISVVFSAPLLSAGTTINASLIVTSNDPDESPGEVLLSADVSQTFAPLVNIPILGASVDDVIDNVNCSDVSGVVQFGQSSGVDSFNVILMDQGGVSVSSEFFTSDAAGGVVAFSGINACSLDDGILKLSVNLGSLDAYVGTPAIKNTSVFPAPVLDPVVGASVFQTIQVCGTSRQSTTVKIEGGASIVSLQLDALTTGFCLDVPLRVNTQNTLIATAIDDLAAPPRPAASAPPVQVVHVDPSSIIIAEATSRPLTIEETELLVANGVIQLDDPSNFNVSMFTIVLTIGQFPVTVSQPVAVPTTASVSYGGSGGSGGWTTGGGGGASSVPRPVTGCVTGCSNIVVIKTPSGQTIPGVIIIDGRIKTLKEFFQVTIAIQNTSTGFVLADMQANIVLPAGLSPVKAGPGTDVSTINTAGLTDSVNLGDIGPLSTGTGQFIIRGDGIGTHNVDVDFNGFLTGGGLPAPEPVSGSAGTSVQVFGPPTFDVVVRHPSDPAGHDVVAGQIYELIVEITNTSPRPALYTSLELFIGGQAELVDVNGVPIPDSNEIRSFGHIPSGRTVSAAFRVKSSLQGEIIACQAIASENISLTVDTGPDGTACNIANTYPANFEPLAADQPPVVIGINPLNGQPNVVVTSSVFATLTPESACIVGDTFNNVVEAPIDPLDLTKGIQVLSANLVQAGTFYLEELDTFGNPVKHIPTDLTVESPPAGGTTIAVLRLGLDTPHNNSQYFLRDNTTYRATLVGGAGGVCNKSPLAAEMEQSFTWTFSTEQTCSIAPPIATMSAPPNGSIDQPLNQSIVLNFTNRMNPGSFAFIPGDLPNSTFSVYADAIESGGDISGGTAIAGGGVFSNLNRTLTYNPTLNFAEDVPVYIRLTDGLRDICGNPLQTDPTGVKLLSFQTIPPDTLAPVAPLVNPLPTITNLPSVQVSGSAEAGSTVTVAGVSIVKNTTASAGGLFSVSVPLNLNTTNNFAVQATDASGNASAISTSDSNGDPLTTVHDNVLPVVASVFPSNGAIDVARNIVIQANFDEQIDPATINDFNFTLEGSVIPGTLAPVGTTGFSFTPDNLLDFNKTYNIRIRANGMRDLAGNGLTSENLTSFTTQNFPLPVINSAVPDSGVQGTTFAVVFTGSNLVTTTAVVSANPGISGSIVSSSDTSVTANITIDALAATGLTTVGLTTLGGSTSLPFTVLHKAPVINSIVPDSGDQGATVNAQIQGSGLTDVSSISIDGTGVSVVDLNTGNDSITNVQIVIDVTAPAGARNVTVSTPGGSDSVVFNITVPVVPVLSSVTPDNGEQASSFDVTFVGTNLANVTTISSADPQISASIISLSDTSIVANLTIGATATVGITSLSVVAPQGTSNVLTFTVNLALNIITLTPPSLNILTLETTSMNVAIDTIAGAGGQVINLLSSNTTIATVPASVTIPQGGNNVSFTLTTNNTAGVTNISATGAGFVSDSGQVTVNARGISLDLLSPFIGVGRSSSGTVILAQPAPSGGVTVNFSTGNATIATVNPASVFIAQGSTTAAFNLDGLVIGTTPLTATANGYNNAVEDIFVTSSNVVNFGLIPDVAPGQNVSLPTSLGQPAPSGGLTINFTSSNPAIATVTPSVFIPEGLQVPAANPQITGILIGSVQITGTATGFAPDIRVANVTLDANFSPVNLSVVESGTKNITLQISAPAPAGGLSFNLSTDDSAIATVPSTVTVGVGQTSAQIIVTGVAVGATTLRANSPGINETTANVTVNPQPAINIGNTSVGKDLQIGLSGSLGLVAPAGGVQVTLTSSDPSKVLLSTNRTAAGSGSIIVPVNAGSNSISVFYVQSMTDTGTVTITATAPGYATDTSSVTSAPSGFWINASSFTRDVFAANAAFGIRSARLNPTTLNLAAHEELRAGLTVNVDLTNSDSAVGTLTVNPVVFSGGSGVQINTAFDPVSAGATTITLVQPTGFDVPANVNTSIVATVTAPSIFLSNVTVGKDLQTTSFISLSNAPPSPVDVTVTIAASSVALISTSRTTVGSSSVTFSGVTGTSVGTIYIQGLAIGSTQITVQAAAYNDDTSSVTVDPSGFWINASSFTRDVFAANAAFGIRSARLNPTTLNLAAHEELRAGLTVNVDLTNSDSAVGTLTVNPVVFSGGSGVQINTAFDPVSAGATTITLVQPTGFDVPANVNTSIVATVTAPSIFLSNVTVGKDLQTTSFISLSNAPPSPVDVTVTIAASSVALISTSRTTVGSSSVTFSGVTGTSVGTIYIQGLAIGSTQITVQAAAYNDDTSSVTVDPSGFWINASSFTRDVFAANAAFGIRSARLNPTTLNLAAHEELRAGLTVNVDLTNSDSAVGTLTVNPVVFSGGSGVQINTAFDPVSAGATTITLVQPTGFDVPANVNTSIVATVTAPSIFLSNVTVGKDLQTTSFISLSNAPPSPVDVTVTIAASSVALISTSRTTVGSSSVTFSGVTGTSVGTIYIQGLAIGSTQITVQAAAYNDDTSSVTVDPSGFWINASSFTRDVFAANAAFGIRSARLNPTTLNLAAHEELRAGLTVNVDLTNSDSAVGTLTVNPVVFSGGSGVQINTAFDPVSAGATTITLVQPTGFDVPANVNTSIVATVTGL